MLRFETVPGNETADDAIVFLAFAADDAYLVADDRHAPRFPRRLLFFDDGPLTRIDRVEAIRIDRSHPEFITVERKRLRARRRRGQPQRFGYMMHARTLSFWSPAPFRPPSEGQSLPLKAIEARVTGLDCSCVYVS